MKKKHTQYKQMFGGMNSEEKKDLLLTAKSNVDAISIKSKKSKALKEMVEEFEFMRDVKTIDDLKNVIKTSKYWADVWAVSTLERLYNVKFIILAKDNFVKGEIENVLQCGEIDKKLQEKGIFEPDYYILTSYDGIHYELITYDKNVNKTAFKFKGLPYRIKELVLEKCMEKNSGPFNIIPEFKDFAAKNNVNVPDPKSEIVSLVKEPKNDLYDENIIIQIFKRSADRPVGDKKSSDTVKIEKLKFNDNFIQLNEIKEWRKKLDNEWNIENYMVDEKEYISVQHYMYASRFINIPEVFNKFNKQSQHPAGKSIDEAKKLYDAILKDKTYKSKIIKEDDYEKDKSRYLFLALRNKFSIDEYKKILLLTGDAKITIFKPGKYGGVIDANELMKVRKLLL